MKQGQFEKLYGATWIKFETLLNEVESKADRNKIPSRAINEFTQLYRKTCHFHSLARERGYSSYLVDRLGDLIVRGHQQLYKRKHHLRQTFIQFFLYEFPNAVRREQKLVWLATLLLYGPALLLYVFVLWQPDLVYSVLDPMQAVEFEEMYNPANRIIGKARDAETNWYMFGFYIANNIGVSFQTFASGLLYGVGTIFFLVYNGLLFGAVAGHLTNIGYTDTFFTFVVGHGSFELTAIVIAGAAGLKLGLSLLSPGNFTRLESLRRAAQVAIQLVYGVIFMLVVAAFIEAFWSSNNALLGWQKYFVGGVFWAFVILYFFIAGRAGNESR